MKQKIKLDIRPKQQMMTLHDLNLFYVHGKSWDAERLVVLLYVLSGDQKPEIDIFTSNLYTSQAADQF